MLSDPLAPPAPETKPTGAAASRPTASTPDQPADTPGPAGDASDAASAITRDAATPITRDATSATTREAATATSRDAAAATTSDADALCGAACTLIAPHLLISEVVFRPAAAEMIEIVNPTLVTVDLSSYLLSDSHRYWQMATGSASSAGADFVARFPPGATIAPGGYRTVAVANSGGGSASFELAYGRKPDFELRPLAHGASDDASVPNMVNVAEAPATSIGTTASLTDEGEPVVLFQVDLDGQLRDVDYVYFGRPSEVNPVVDKSQAEDGAAGYARDTAATEQHPVPVPSTAVAIHRCGDGEIAETASGGNGLFGHDETSEDARRSFIANDTPSPGGPAPPEICRGAR